MAKSPIKTWFAEKRNGEIIELTEREALTHFERNNISQRMGLRFIGTSSGEHYFKAKQEIENMLREALQEQGINLHSLSVEERNRLVADMRVEHADTIKEKFDAAYSAELEEARTNGVERPDKTLRIATMSEGGGQAGSSERNKIISELKGRL